MASKGRTLLQSIQVQQLTCMVHRRSDQEITGVVELAAPDRLLMILKGVAARCVEEIPNLHCAITGRSSQMGTTGVESNTGNPVFVAFTRHDEVSVGDSPDFPSEVVTCSSQDRLSWVEGNAGD
jgi:hypothetical protein